MTALAQVAPPTDGPPVAAPAAPGVPQAAPAAGEAAPTIVQPLPSAAPVSDAERFDEVEQTARIAARKLELLEEEAAKKAKESPKVTADDKGFSIRLPDNAFVLRIRGLVQADGRFFLDNPALAANDTFLVRKFRPSLEGTLFGVIDFRLLPELAGTPQVLDGWVDLHFWDWLRLRAGKMKAPIGLERLQGDADRVFLEQALIANLSSQRDVGVQLWGDIKGGLVHYVAGIFNGSPDNVGADTDSNHAKDFIGRLFVHPFRTDGLKDFGNLGVGVSVQTGNRKGRLPVAVAGLPIPYTPAVTWLSPFRTAGQVTFFQYLAPVTDTTGALTTFTHERSTRVNPQLYYYYDSIGLLSEYMWLSQGVQRGNSTAELTQQSAAVTASYTINGRENYDGTTPLVGLDREKGAWGALVIAARWSWLSIDEATFPVYANPIASARTANAFGAAVTWVPRRTARYSLSWEQTRFEGGAGVAASGMTAAVIGDRQTENVIIGRAQANF